jgi:hypothetical protein
MDYRRNRCEAVREKNPPASLPGVEAGGRPPMRARSALNDERGHLRCLDHLATDENLKTKGWRVRLQ